MIVRKQPKMLLATGDPTAAKEDILFHHITGTVHAQQTSTQSLCSAVQPLLGS